MKPPEEGCRGTLTCDLQLCTKDSNRTDGMTHPTGFNLNFSDTHMFGLGVVEEDAADDLERAATLIRRSVNMSYTTKESKNT